MLYYLIIGLLCLPAGYGLFLLQYWVRYKYFTWDNHRMLRKIAAMEATQAWRIINELREDTTGSYVTILCDNEEPPPGAAILCNGNWTGWNDRRFDGDTLLAALKDARTAYQAWKLEDDKKPKGFSA